MGILRRKNVVKTITFFTTAWKSPFHTRDLDVASFALGALVGIRGYEEEEEQKGLHAQRSNLS